MKDISTVGGNITVKPYCCSNSIIGQTSPRLSDELEAEIENELSYDDSKSEWIREAIRISQEIEPCLR
jgi:hypothetical protein